MSDYLYFFACTHPSGYYSIDHACDVFLADLVERVVPVLMVMVGYRLVERLMAKGVFSASYSAKEDIVALSCELHWPRWLLLIGYLQELLWSGEHAVDEEEWAFVGFSWHLAFDMKHHYLVAARCHDRVRHPVKVIVTVGHRLRNRGVVCEVIWIESVCLD